jgi:transcriptional regulator with XRE-family HTH domain
MNEPTLGERLRYLRHRRGETLEQVSEATGLSVAMLSRIERGERLPSPESTEALAAHFGLSPDDLLGDAIATRMLNRYGQASLNLAAQRLQNLPMMPQAEPEPWSEHPLAEVTYTEASEDEAALADAGDMTMSVSACVPSAPTPAAWDAEDEDRPELARPTFRTRPVEELFPRSDALEALADARRVAEVALDSALAAAARAIASGDERLAAEGRATIQRLRKRLRER